MTNESREAGEMEERWFKEKQHKRKESFCGLHNAAGRDVCAELLA